MPDIKIGTRPSRLAMKQADMVYRRMVEAGMEAKIVPVTSSGDVDTETPLYQSKGTGIFSNEINKMVMKGELDAAVHSAKDLPSLLPDGMAILVPIPRDSFHDAFVSSFTIEAIMPGANIGTSSLRRIRELAMIRSDLSAKDIRGNIDTRIRKLQEGYYDGIILAEAGLNRMNVDISYERLDVKNFMPAPNQGIIAVTIRKDSDFFSIMEHLIDRESQNAMEIERSIMRTLNLGCSVPAGILARRTGASWTVDVRLHSLTNREFMDFSSRVSGADDAADYARQIMADLPVRYGYKYGEA